MTQKYADGTKVWLGAWEGQPREKAVIESYDPGSGMYVVRVEPINVVDDGLRELSEDQIEGLQ